MNQTVTALVPMRHGSERVPGKNYRSFAGRPLYHHVVRMLLACPLIGRVVIDTDSHFIMEDAAANFPEVLLMERAAHLRDGDTPMNEVLLHDVKLLPGEWFLQTHCTNPLLKSETIGAALERFFAALPEFDSLFTVTAVRSRFWDLRGRPLNHNPMRLMRTQDLEPIFEENSNLYLFSRELLIKHGNRIGEKPLMFEIDRLEAVDIDEELDFTFAEFLFRERERVVL